MRHLIRTALVSLALAACGKDSTAPEQGQIAFRFDQLTCGGTTGSATLEFFIDGASRGSYPLSVGAEQSFSVDAGPHTAAARLTNTALTWPTRNVTVGAGQKFAVILPCG